MIAKHFQFHYEAAEKWFDPGRDCGSHALIYSFPISPGSRAFDVAHADGRIGAETPSRRTTRSDRVKGARPNASVYAGSRGNASAAPRFANEMIRDAPL
jgi:hypothetical protein